MSPEIPRKGPQITESPTMTEGLEEKDGPLNLAKWVAVERTEGPQEHTRTDLQGWGSGSMSRPLGSGEGPDNEGFTTERYSRRAPRVRRAPVTNLLLTPTRSGARRTHTEPRGQTVKEVPSPT